MRIQCRKIAGFGRREGLIVDYSKSKFEVVAFTARTVKCVLASGAATSTITTFSSQSWFEGYPGESNLLSKDYGVFGGTEK